MKRFFYTAMLLAGLMTISCTKEEQKNEKEPIPHSGLIEHEVQIIAGKPETKTHIATGEAAGTYDVIWDNTDQIALFQKIDNSWKNKKSSTATSVNTTDNTASFTVSLIEDTTLEDPTYKYVAVSPTGAATRSGENLNLVIPSAQTLKDGTYDPAADVLVSSVVTRKPFSSDALSLNFGRAGATARMVVKGLTAGEKVTSVTFSTTESSKNLAGTLVYDIDTEKITNVSSGKQSITLTAEAPGIAVPAAVGDNPTEFVVWFRTAEVTLTENFTITIITTTSDDKIVEYTKTVEFAGGKKIELKNSCLTKFSVNGLTRTERGSSTTYAELVTSSTTPALAAGDIILIVNGNSNVAMSTTQNSNNRSKVAVSISNDGKIESIPAAVQLIELETGVKPVNNVNTTYWAFNVGNGTSNSYLYAASSSENQLKTRAYMIKANNDSDPDYNALWNISIDASGVASILAQGGNTRNDLRYNSSSSLFSCYGSNNTQSQCQIYRVVGGRKSAKLSFSASSYEVTLGGSTAGKPTLTNPNSLSVTYSSSDTDVAAVDESTGELTLVGAGTATITATSGETTEFLAGSASYEITVNKIETAISFETADYIVSGMSLPGVTAPAGFTGQVLTNVASLSPITYSSSNTTLATVSSDGTVTLQSGKYGKAVITASYAGDDEHAAATDATYTIYVPYSPAEASAAATSNGVSNQCVYGVVESIDGKNFYLSADGTNNDRFLIYWNSNNNKPSEGDILLVQGQLIKYNNTTPELNSTITIVKKTAASGTVETPSFSPSAGQVAMDTEVTISCETEGAVIYYTTNGDTPSSASTQGTKVTVTQGMTIKAVAVKIGMKKSSASAAYTLRKMNSPVFLNTADDVPRNTVVNLSAEDDATVYYTTTDDNYPSENWIEGKSITITEEATIRAIAVKDKCINSDIVSHDYQISQVAQPSFTVAEGAVEIGTEVGFECVTEGATIYYSTDTEAVYPTGNWVSATKFTVNSAVDLKIIAVKENWDDSEYALAGYTIKKVAKPTYTEKGAFITLSCDTEGATIYYIAADDVIDEPEINTSTWTAYENPFELTANKYLYIAARKTNYLDSEVNEQVFAAPSSNFTVTGAAVSTDGSGNTVLTLGDKAGNDGKKSFSVVSPYSWSVTEKAVETGITDSNLSYSEGTQTKGDGSVEVSYAVANSTSSVVDLGTLTLTDAKGTTKTIVIKQAAKSSAPQAGTILWADDFGSWGVSSTTFTQLPQLSEYTYTGRTGYSDNTDVTLTASSNQVRGATSSGGNCTGGHLWFNKSQNATVSTSSIRLYGVTSLVLSYDQGTSNSSLTAGYSTDGGTNWTNFTPSGPAPSTTNSFAFTVEPGTTSIILRFVHSSSNAANTRFDNPKLVVGNQ